MYKKYMAILLLGNGILAGAFWCVNAIQMNRIMATPAFRLYLADELSEEKETSFMGIVAQVASDQRVLDYGVLKREVVYDIGEKDYEALLRIVEAEAGGEDETGKLLVANVVLNRVKNPAFPDTVQEVIFQRENGTSQFSPVANGRYYRVTVSEETTEVVDRALRGEDVSEGALYFVARKYANPEKMRWFDRKLQFLFAHGGHEFFS